MRTDFLRLQPLHRYVGFPVILMVALVAACIEAENFVNLRE